MLDGGVGSRGSPDVYAIPVRSSVVEAGPMSPGMLMARPVGRRLAKGFTLIELMVVVAVVAILAAIA